MTLTLVLPGFIAVLLGVTAGLYQWPMRPKPTVRLLSVIAAVTALTALGIVIIAAFGFATQSIGVLSLTELCPAVGLAHDVGTVEGLIALVLLGAIVVRVGRIVRLRRQAVAGTAGKRFHVLNTAKPIAYAAPSKPGCVVVSSGLLEILEPLERQVVFAHERAHLHQKHHRFLMVGALSVAVVPPLGPLVKQLRLATERCADEAAATVMQDNRELVATSIARVALAAFDFQGTVAAAGGSSVPIRVDALLGEPTPRRIAIAALLATATTAIAVIAASSIQAHHFAELFNHVCAR